MYCGALWKPCMEHDTGKATFLKLKVSIPVEIKRRDAGRKAVDFLQHDRLTTSLLYKKKRRHERIRKNKTV